jgi:3-isopropylmalate/(R)-2-methylmalate dehydratase small subunit
MMEPVRVVTGTAVPLDRSDVDTDQIIPSDWLKRVERTGFGRGLFSEWRDDRDFVLNQAQYTGATVLIAGPNFGTGSSREHAVWALMDYGFKAVISPQFGDIFRTNCTKAGLVPAQVAPEAGAALLRAVADNPALEVTVDVEQLRVVAPGVDIEAAFPLDPFTQHCLLEGLDDIGLTLQYSDDIGAYEQRRPDWLPSVTV